MNAKGNKRQAGECCIDFGFDGLPKFDRRYRFIDAGSPSATGGSKKKTLYQNGRVNVN